MLHAPRAGTSAEEVGAFVRSLLAHGQLDTPIRAFGAVAEAAPAGGKPTHGLVDEGGRQELRRIRFA